MLAQRYALPHVYFESAGDRHIPSASSHKDEPTGRCLEEDEGGREVFGARENSAGDLPGKAL